MRLPILVGITGKRNINPDQAASLEERLGRVFAQVDADFPHVPKVLLTGGAYGADTIAAELLTHADKKAATSFRDWSVVVLLPFDQVLFEKDFRPKAEADPTKAAEAEATATKRLGQLRDLLSAERVLVRKLPLLQTSADSQEQVRPEQLDKDSPKGDTALRRAHYEQVGQFIAEAATILIAILDGEEEANRDQADGGTARVVACRRAGRPDELGMDVARHSTVLRREWGTLVASPTRHVWLIEPSSISETRGYPVAVLPPLGEASGLDAYAGPALPTLGIGGLRWWNILQGNRQRREARRQLAASLVIPKAFEGFHRAAEYSGQRKAAERNPAPRDEAAGPSPLDLSRADQPADALRDIRDLISRLQRAAKASADRAFKTIAALFVLAVLALEVFAKFLSDSPYALGCYLLLLLAIFGMVTRARMRRWQAISEDYRAAAEMLRVQRAWWSAGLRDRVDHLHLQEADPELSRIRYAVRTILAWVWLRSGWTSAEPDGANWAHVRGHDAGARSAHALLKGKIPSDWIGGQIWYFAKNHERHHRTVLRLAAVTWSLFAASFWLAALLCFWLSLHGSQEWFMHVAGKAEWLPNGRAAPASGLAAWLVLALGLVALWAWLASRPHPHGAGLPGSRWAATALTVLVGLAIAVPFALAIQGGATLLAGPADSHATALATEKLTVLVFVMLSAVAGATRYVSEKLNFEAQALEYRDALARFERAERLLARDANPASGVPADEERARQVVRDLALLALRENEAWLKAHRERPLSPVVG